MGQSAGPGRLFIINIVINIMNFITIMVMNRLIITKIAIKNVMFIPIMVIIGLAAMAGCLAPLPFDERAWQKTVAAGRPADLYAPHRDTKGRFFNPWLPQNRSSWEVARWFLSANSLPELDKSPSTAPAVQNDGAYLKDPKDQASLTWVGHATFAVNWDGQVVVTDPFFSERAWLVKRLVPPAFGPETIPPGAVVVISHNHYDHLDEDSVKALAAKSRFVCPLGLGGLLREMGAQKITELDWWQSIEIDGTVFTCLPAQHWSRRLGQGYNESLWCAWLLSRGQRKVFYGGDSGYFIGFKEIGRRHPGIDVALMPVGAYAPRWFMHYAHMDMAEVLTAFADLGAKAMVPTQWGVLKLGDEPAAWPAKALGQAMGGDPALKARVKIMPVGGRLMLD